MPDLDDSQTPEGCGGRSQPVQIENTPTKLLTQERENVQENELPDKAKNDTANQTGKVKGRTHKIAERHLLCQTIC